MREADERPGPCRRRTLESDSLPAQRPKAPGRILTSNPSPSGVPWSCLFVRWPSSPDGLRLCQWLRQSAEGHSLAVVHLSGVAVGLAERVRGLELGADGYLTKPVAPEELVATLRASIRARSGQNR